MFQDLISLLLVRFAKMEEDQDLLQACVEDLQKPAPDLRTLPPTQLGCEILVRFELDLDAPVAVDGGEACGHAG